MIWELICNMSAIQHKRGPQTRAERIETRKTLQPHFEQHVPAYKAAKITGYDVKTVNRHYDQLYREIHGYISKNFVKRYEKERMRTVISFDNLIYESYEMLEYVKNEILDFKNKRERIPHNLIQSHSKIIRDIEHLEEKKAYLLMLPDAGDMIDEEVKKRLGKHV